MYCTSISKKRNVQYYEGVYERITFILISMQENDMATDKNKQRSSFRNNNVDGRKYSSGC